MSTSTEFFCERYFHVFLESLKLVMWDKCFPSSYTLRYVILIIWMMAWATKNHLAKRVKTTIAWTACQCTTARERTSEKTKPKIQKQKKNPKPKVRKKWKVNQRKEDFRDISSFFFVFQLYRRRLQLPHWFGLESTACTELNRIEEEESTGRQGPVIFVLATIHSHWECSRFENIIFIFRWFALE